MMPDISDAFVRADISEAFVNHLWQSTVFAGLVWIAALALRHHGARVRYWLWAAASVKFLLPLAWLIALGGQVEWRSAPVAAQPAAFFVVGEAFSSPIPLVLTAREQAFDTSWVLSCIWFAGFATTLFWWWQQWKPVRAGLRDARPLSLDPVYNTQGLRVMASSSTFEPGVVGIWRPVLLVPEDLLNHLTPAQMNALIVHERSHVRHLDNLFAALHMAVEAIFWFHPLVWWIERQLIDERERGCDEDVLRSGSHRGDYAAGILAVCRLNVPGALPCVAGITGSDLRRRIESILRGTLGRQVTTGQRAALVLTAALCFALPIAAGAINEEADRALRLELTAVNERDLGVELVPQEARAARPLKFEAASVKRNISGDGEHRNPEFQGATVVAINVPLATLITAAYGVPARDLLDGPRWIYSSFTGSEGYDVIAKAAEGTSPQDQRAMLRDLLEDRFGLRLRRETRQLPVYILTKLDERGGLGPRLRKAAKTCLPYSSCGGRMGAGFTSEQGAPWSSVVQRIGQAAGERIVDRTGLSGVFDFELTYTTRTLSASSGESGLDVFAAVREQLGLKLEAGRAPFEISVVEAVRRPTPN